MIKQDNFSIEGSNGKLIYGDITYDDSNITAPLILFVHGFKGFKDWGAHNLIARHFAENGFKYAKFNFTHSGVTKANFNDVTDLESFAANTFSKELFDLDVAIDFLTKNYSDDEKVSLIGHSRGGGIAIITAAENARVKALITWSSIAAFNSLWKKEQEAEWKKEGKIYVENARTKEKMPLNKSLLEDFESNFSELNIIDAAKHIDIPWLIVHGDDDVNVPFETAQKLANASLNSRLIKIKGANHVYGASQPYKSDDLPPQLFEVVEKSLRFLEQI